MSQKIYRTAAIGHTGAGNYGHGLHLAYKGLENVEFIAVADPVEAGRKKAMAETGALRGYIDYHEMLDQEDLDIVSVCPHAITEHLDMVLACLEANCHVYCEKPITATLADGDTIVNAATGKGLKVAVAHQGVYLPSTQTIKKMLDEGKIGRIQAIYAHGKQDQRGWRGRHVHAWHPPLQHDALLCRGCQMDARPCHGQRQRDNRRRYTGRHRGCRSCRRRLCQ